MHNSASTIALNPPDPPSPSASMSGITNLHPSSLPADRAASLISGVSSIPLQLFSEGNRLTAKERQFLEAAERGDKATVERCLQPPNPVNVNVTNILGRSALQMVVDNENVEIVELLLKQDRVEIGDALLYAIREGVYKMVEMMVNHPSISRQMLGEGWSTAHQRRRQESSDYSHDISPVILAAHCNQFEILQLLLTRGATISKPHPVICNCDMCRDKQNEDSLRYSLHRINTYKALASPAWISLTSSDPILSAFKLSWELMRLAVRENEFKDIYTTLSDQAKEYAVDLLDQCRSSEEVIAVLNKDSESDDEFPDDDVNTGKLTLNRLQLALKYEQKQFTAHPHTQQLLSTIWYEGLPGWRGSNWLIKSVICISVVACMPFLAVYYLIFPRSRLGSMLRSPFMKFMNHSASFVLFLVLLVLASTRIAETTDPEEANQRGAEPGEIEIIVLIWAFGMVWGECKQLWEEGLKAYIRQWWNWLDFIMLSLYLCTFALRIGAIIEKNRADDPPDKYNSRADWNWQDPTLLAEGVFAVANVFSFARIIYLFQANPYLGPLQISLGCMLIDIAKFFVIFFLILLSFACGMNQLYWYYNYNVKHGIDTKCNKTKYPDIGDVKEITGCKFVEFDGLGASLITLMWALFGLVSKDVVQLHMDHTFIETMGEFMFLAYQLLSIVVLLNMLIAMMSNSFQTIQDHADREWKFARSKLWMNYFDEGSTLPPPFNLIPSPKSFYYAAIATKRFFMSFTKHRRVNSKPRKRRSLDDGVIKTGDILGPNVIGPNVTPETRYQDVMKRLVSRYIHQTKAERKEDGVNEDDLNEIKQDISSLRYELREDRKRELARERSNVENIKLDLLRSVNPIAVPATQDENMNDRDVNLTLPLGNSKHNSPKSPKIMVTPISPTTPPVGMPLPVLPSTCKEDLETLRTEIISDIRSELRKELREELRSELRHAMLEAIQVSRSSTSNRRDSYSSTPPPHPPLPDFAMLQQNRGFIPVEEGHVTIEERHDGEFVDPTAPVDHGDISSDEAARRFFAYPPPPASPFETTPYNRHWYTQL